MSTTPITFERNNLEYTLTGSNDEEILSRRSGLSILLLNRGGKPFRKDLLFQLAQLGTREIISVETSSSRLNPEDLQKELPQVRFLFIQSPASWGEIINISIKEAMGEFVFVLWNDMDIQSQSISSRVFSKIEERQTFCTLPWLYDSHGELYPSRYIPAQDNEKKLKMIPLPPVNAEDTSLFPFDYTGIYHRRKFLQCGGFDGNIQNPYWQLMDFGFRGAMGGEVLMMNGAIKIHYQYENPAMDITVDEDYIQFFLKTLAIRKRGERVFLPSGHLWQLWLKTPLSLKKSMMKIKRIKQWVRSNQSFIKYEAAYILEHWGDF